MYNSYSGSFLERAVTNFEGATLHLTNNMANAVINYSANLITQHQTPGPVVELVVVAVKYAPYAKILAKAAASFAVASAAWSYSGSRYLVGGTFFLVVQYCCLCSTITLF